MIRDSAFVFASLAVVGVWLVLLADAGYTTWVERGLWWLLDRLHNRSIRRARHE